MAHFIAFFVLCSSALNAHFFIHMDVNRTIISKDCRQSYTTEDFVNLCLAKEVKKCWDSSLSEPIDFYTYVYTHLLPGSRKNRELRNKRRDVIHNFMHLFSKQFPSESRRLQKRYNESICAVEKNGSALFPSFYELVDHLSGHNDSFTIFFRTFGNDLDWVTQQVKSRYPEARIPMVFSKSGCLYHEGKEITLRDLYTLGMKHTFVAVQDDFSYWNSHNEKSSFGKIMPIDETHTCLFFDDNIDEANEQTNIVYPVDIHTSTPCSLFEHIHNGSIVRVNTLDALMNEHFFIEKLHIASN